MNIIIYIRVNSYVIIVNSDVTIQLLASFPGSSPAFCRILYILFFVQYAGEEPGIFAIQLWYTKKGLDGLLRLLLG